MTLDRPTIAIFNVKHSPNLGDGLLAECLEAEVRAACPAVAVMGLDLAGRRGYGGGGRLRHLQLAMLERLPPRARQLAAGLFLRRLARRRLAPEWRRRLAEVDAVIVGGGNLFADADLNFPIKLAAALGEAALRRLPVAVHGVGVTPNWSPAGARLFRAGLAANDLRSVTVRDERSRAAWDRLLDPAEAPRAAITADPGLLAARHFPAPARTAGAVPHIALGLTDPVALRYHGGDASGGILKEWFGRLVAALARQPCRISLFTNGSPEDRRFLARVAPAIRAGAPGAVAIAPAFARPADLARFVAGCDLVMAHRMHACIAAYAYRIPTIGFVWDVKLRSFFELTDRADCLLDPAAIDPSAAAARAHAALRAAIEPVLHARLVDRCRTDIAAVVDRLVASDQRRA